MYGHVDDLLIHDCISLIEYQTKIREDLEEEELIEGEKWCVDGSSRMEEGKRKSGYAIIDGKKRTVLESGPLSPSWSAQACELYALLKALQRLKRKVGTIFTDSKYAFGVVHTFGKIWEERGLINTQSKGLIHEDLIRQILTAIREPERVAVVHVKGHQKGQDFYTRGNNRADYEAKKAASTAQEIEAMPIKTLTEQKEKVFTKEKIQKFQALGIVQKDDKWILPDGREMLPKAYAKYIISRLHQTTHWGTQALADQFLKYYGCIDIHDLTKQEVQGCLTCQKVNRSNFRAKSLGGRKLACRPFQRIQVDFTELPKVGRYRYLLVIVDQLTHWVEAYPTAKATTRTVVKHLLEEVIPRFGMVIAIDSDEGTRFTSKVLKETVEALRIKWEFHTPWHPQSSGRVERMNGLIKAQLTKLMIETRMSWVKCLPLALLNIRTRSQTSTGLSPYEMLYGMPYSHGIPVQHPKVEDASINTYITTLARIIRDNRQKGIVEQTVPLGFPIHKIEPGDQVLIKTWRETSLNPRWEGLFLVLLTTDTAIRTAEKGWTHATWVKGPIRTSH